MIRRLPAIAAALLSLSAPLAAQDEGEENYFGKQDKTRSGLIAIIYDLKQTQSRQPSGVGSDRYPAVIREFLEKGWDEVVLNRFFRITRPLYATQIFIPRIDAGAAPKAFGVQDLIQPRELKCRHVGLVAAVDDSLDLARDTGRRRNRQRSNHGFLREPDPSATSLHAQL